MADDNYRPRTPEDSPGKFGDSGSIPMTDKARKPGYGLSKSLPDCDAGCLSPDAGYTDKGKMSRSDVASDKGFA